MTELKTYRLYYTQTTVREIVLSARDAEEATCLAQADLFTPRDTSQIVATYLGQWRYTCDKD